MFRFIVILLKKNPVVMTGFYYFVSVISFCFLHKIPFHFLLK